jgi:hypothetical protein
MSELISALVLAVLTACGLALYTIQLRRRIDNLKADEATLIAKHNEIIDAKTAEIEDLKARHRADEDTMVARHSVALGHKDEQIGLLQQQVLEGAAMMGFAANEIAELRAELLLVRQRELPVLADIRAGIEGAVSAPGSLD